MDLMDIRRTMMGVIAGMAGSIFDGMLEIVDSFTPTEETGTHKFLFTPDPGFYLLLSNPPGIIDNLGQYDQILSCTYFSISGTSPSIHSGASTTARIVSGNSYYDYWGAVITLESDGVTIVPASSDSRKYMKPGFTYYLCKAKGM